MRYGKGYRSNGDTSVQALLKQGIDYQSAVRISINAKYYGNQR